MVPQVEWFHFEWRGPSHLAMMFHPCSSMNGWFGKIYWNPPYVMGKTWKNLQILPEKKTKFNDGPFVVLQFSDR